MYRTAFTVRGTGTFPFDMLRYDRCTPCGQSDVNRMLDEVTEAREVQLVSYHKYKKSSVPTLGRWNSFGWYVMHQRAAEKVA